MRTGGFVTGQTDVWLKFASGFRLAAPKRVSLTDRSDESIALRKSERPS